MSEIFAEKLDSRKVSDKERRMLPEEPAKFPTRREDVVRTQVQGYQQPVKCQTSFRSLNCSLDVSVCLWS